MSKIETLRLAVQRTELAHLRARVALLEAEMASAQAKTPQATAAGPMVFDPKWKLPGRPHLSPAGEAAILSAYDSGLSQGQVARLFIISERAAANWQARWQAAQAQKTEASTHS